MQIDSRFGDLDRAKDNDGLTGDLGLSFQFDVQADPVARVKRRHRI
jgi:hypothetical protein